MSRDSGHLFAMGLTPQANYQTATTPTTAPKNFEQVVKEGYELADYAPISVTNQGLSTGSPFATKSKINAHDVTQTFAERMTSQLVGRRLLPAFGGYSVVQVAAGVYDHTFTPLAPNAEQALPVYPYVEKINEPASDVDILHDLLYPSFAAESFALSSPSEISNGAFLMATTNWRGSGKQIGSAQTAQTGSGVNFGIGKNPSHVVLDADKNENFFSSTAAAMNFFTQPNQAGTNIPLACDFRGLNFNHNNNLLTEQGYQGCALYQNQTDPNSGNVRGNMPVGNQTTELTFMALVTKAFAQNPNPMRLLRTQAEFSLRLNWAGGLIANVAGTDYFHNLTFEANKLTAKSVKVDSTDTLDMFTVQAETLSPGASQPYRFILRNNIASYLTL